MEKSYSDRICMRYILKRRIRVPGLYKWRGREEEMGERGKVNGGRGEGLDWCLVKAGVRHTRIPDPAHVLSARGKERNADNHRMRGPFNLIVCLILW